MFDNIFERLESIEERLESIERKMDELSIANKETLNSKEAAKYLDVSRSHLYKLTYKKEIPHYKPRGKNVFFERKELDKWLLQNHQTTKSEIEKGGKR